MGLMSTMLSDYRDLLKAFSKFVGIMIRPAIKTYRIWHIFVHRDQQKENIYIYM